MGKAIVGSNRLLWFTLALLFALTTPFQNCGPVASSPGNGQGYEGVKHPTDGSGNGTYDPVSGVPPKDPPAGGGGNAPPPPDPAPQPAPIPLPPEVTGIKIDSNFVEYSMSPAVYWTQTDYAHFQNYQVSIFTWPGLMQLNGWGVTGQNQTKYSGLTLTDGQQYVMAVRIQGPSGTGPVTFSPPWMAYVPQFSGGDTGSGGN